LIAITFISIKILQLKLPNILPHKLKTFDFLPIWFTSLRPYDRNIKKLKCYRSDPSLIYTPNANDNGFAAFIRRTSTIGPLIVQARRLSLFNPLEYSELSDYSELRDSHEVHQNAKIDNKISYHDSPKSNHDFSARF